MTPPIRFAALVGWLVVFLLGYPAKSSGENSRSVAAVDTIVPIARTGEFPDQAYALIAGFRVVWLGEMHGTNEAPALCLGLVRLVARHEIAPVVALEIPHGDQKGIDDFIKTGDSEVLKTQTFFSGPLDGKDGRSSCAMVKLLKDLRAEKIARVLCIDPAPVIPGERDRGMADRIATGAKQYPGRKVIVLTGNVHSRVTVGTPWNKAYRPAAFLLQAFLPSLVTFDLRYGYGTIWARTKEGLGEHTVKGLQWNGSAPFYFLLRSKTVEGHRGVLYSRTVSGSPPWP